MVQRKRDGESEGGKLKRGMVGEGGNAIIQKHFWKQQARLLELSYFLEKLVYNITN